MIDFITGKPRTGKSYRAVKYILDLYLDENKEPPYKYIITNIGGFKFEYINDKFDSMGRDNYAYKLIYKDFLEHVKNMHQLALDGSEDDELIEYADNHKINDALIVLDEAMLYLKKLDDSMSWFFSYHGHFKVRLIIMCQHPKQVHADYKVHTEFFIHAQPQSKQLINNVMRYKHYDSPDLKDSHKSDTIKTNPEVYKLYKSGEIDKPKKIVYKYIVMFLLFLLFFVFVIYSLFDRMTPDAADTNTTDLSTSSTESKVDLPPYSSFDSDLINIRCNDRFCWNPDILFKNNQISITYLKYILLKHDIRLEYSEVKNEIYRLIPQRLGQSKVTLAKLTDYYYLIPDDIQKQYLSVLFKPVKVDKKRTGVFSEYAESAASHTATSASARRE